MAEKTGAQMVAEALTGTDHRPVLVNGKFYIINSPTIHRLAGCIQCLSGMPKGDSVAGVLQNLGDFGKLAKALSWLIKGDESIAEELSHGTPEECIEGIEKGLSLIDVSVFQRAVALQRYVARLAARNTK